MQKYSLVLPSDHYIPRRNYSTLVPNNFESINGHIIFGIKPNFESTDYGYINFKILKKNKRSKRIFLKNQIKPNAKKYISKGFFLELWNFLINNKKLLEDFKKYHSKILILCKNNVRIITRP